jgi:hypothetical protein
MQGLRHRDNQNGLHRLGDQKLNAVQVHIFAPQITPSAEQGKRERERKRQAGEAGGGEPHKAKEVLIWDILMHSLIPRRRRRINHPLWQCVGR